MRRREVAVWTTKEPNRLRTRISDPAYAYPYISPETAMNRVLRLSALTFLALQLFGCASGAPPAAEAPLLAQPGEQATVKKREELCTPTGSHIARKGKCQMYGQTLSREDLERTGRPDMGQAIRDAMPSAK